MFLRLLKRFVYLPNTVHSVVFNGIAVLLVGLLPGALSMNKAQKAWEGDYRYVHAAGPATRFYSIRVGVTPTDCTLRVERVGAIDEMLCEIGADAEQLSIRFRALPATGPAGQVPPYGRGEELLRLRRAGGGALLTEWAALTAGDGAGLPASRFRKT